VHPEMLMKTKAEVSGPRYQVPGSRFSLLTSVS
jgi:hypothetical protein